MSMTLSNPSGTSGQSKTAVSKAPSLIDKLQQSKDADELVAWVREQYDQMKAARHKITVTWNLNLAMYYGNQWLEVTSLNGGKLILPKAPPYRVRQTINRIRPAVRTEISRLTSQKPTASVVPASSEDEDLAAAYAGEQVWESISSTKDYQRQFRQAMFWMAITGTGFMKTWWDANAIDANGSPGDVKFSAVTPYHLMVPDLRSESIQDQPYVLNLYTRSVEQIRQMYAGKVDIDKMGIAPNVTAANEILDDAVLNLSSTGKTEPDSVLCLEMWLKPGAHKLLPNGGMLHVVGQKLVWWARDGIPYKHGRYPFTKFDHIPTGKFYAESVILDLIGLQREYNRTRSQIIEARNRMAKPKMLYAKGSVDPSKITTEPGQGIEYLPGMPIPQQLPLQPLPNYVLDELNRITLDIEDISGQHQVSKGSAPPGVTAATAISFLQEKDDSLLSHTYSSIEEGCEDIARQALELIKQFWDTQRTIRTVGTDGSFDVLMLQGATINTDIRMEGGSALPTSKAARQAFLMDMMKMGFIPPEEGLKLMDMGGVNKLYTTLKIDESQAQRENIKLKRMDPAQVQDQKMQWQMAAQQGDPSTIDAQTGQPMNPPAAVPVNSWDNHMVHITVHNNYRKTQAFEMLDPAIKAEFEQHVNDHVAAMNDAMAQVQSVTGGGAGPVVGNMGMGGPSPSNKPPMPTTQVDNNGVAPPDTQGAVNG